MDFMKSETVLDLNNIRQVLVRMEETIVFALIERSQFALLPSVYEPKKYIPNFEGSMLDWLLTQVEQIHSQVRRYEAPDETPFFPDQLLPIILPPINYPKILASYSTQINVNDEIKEFYIHDIVPKVSARIGDQLENVGSVSTCDVDCLQALSRRIHFGKFVAESKFQNDKENYIRLIKAKDVKGIEDSITNKAVEDKILERLVIKGEGYGTDPYTKTKQTSIDPNTIAQLYKEYVIPLTKKVEVDYLLRRLEDES